MSTALAGLYARIVTATDGESGHVYVFDSGREVYDFSVPAVYADDLEEIAIGARMFGWQFLASPEAAEDSHYVVPVARRAAVDN